MHAFLGEILHHQTIHLLQGAHKSTGLISFVKNYILLPDYASEPIDGVRIIATGSVATGVKNIGVKNAAGEFCAFIDSDAYPRSDWLTNALRYFEDADIGGVGGPGLTPEEDGLMRKAKNEKTGEGEPRIDDLFTSEEGKINVSKDQPNQVQCQR